MAMKAAPETLAYVAAFDPDRKTPDAIAVVDVDPKSKSYSDDHRHRADAQRRRRAAPLRLERLLLVPVPQRAAPARGAPLPGGAGPALLAHPHPRHQARPQEAQDRQGHRARGGRRQGRLHPPAHRALRAGRHLRGGAGQPRGQGAGRRVPDGPRDLRDSRPVGNRSRTPAVRLRCLVAPRPRHDGDQRVGHARHLREWARSPRSCSAPSMATACTSGTCTSASTCRPSISATSTSWCSSCAPRTTRPRPMASSTASSAWRTSRPRSGPGTRTETSGR